MTKAELIKAVVEKAALSKADAEKTVKAFMAIIQEVLTSGDKLTLLGFGTFSTSKRAARKGTNPQTGKKINIPACTVPKFKPGKGLKTAVNG